jgi:glycosyltransferase involved in cell wall biosynthesis
MREPAEPPSAAAPAVTVLTPTFNRREQLQRVFESLQAQRYRDFEWLVVDDGSSDGTEEAVREWARHAGFPVRFHWQQNAGKHVALNVGVRLARGTFCAVLDSDDWYAPEALERLVARWSEIPPPLRGRFMGVEGRVLDQDGRSLGTPYPAPVVDADHFALRMVHGVQGDTLGMHRTDVVREHPFPEHLGRYVTEAVVWDRIAETHFTRYVDETIGHKHYLPGGLTQAGRDAAAREAMAPGLAFYFRELASRPRYVPLRRLAWAYANLVRYDLHAGEPLWRDWRGASSKTLFAAAAPLGAWYHRRDRRVAAQLRR